MLGVYRKYHLLIQTLNNRAEAAEVSPAPPQEDDWGTTDEEAEPFDSKSRFADRVPIAPWMLLLDALHGQYEDLAEVITMMVYQPVGLDANERAV